MCPSQCDKTQGYGKGVILGAMRRDVFVLDEEPCATGGKQEREKKGRLTDPDGRDGRLGRLLGALLDLVV